MVKVIETNLIILDGNVMDFQSRVIEVESWEQYISYFTDYYTNREAVGYYEALDTNYMKGYVLPKNRAIYNLEYNESKLKCFLRDDYFETVKLAHLVIGENNVKL